MNAQPQTTIYETTIDNAKLEELLENRQGLKAKKSDATKKFKEANDDVKAMVRTLDLGDAPVRCGRFVITEKAIEEKHVEFDRSAGSRLQISLIADE